MRSRSIRLSTQHLRMFAALLLCHGASSSIVHAQQLSPSREPAELGLAFARGYNPLADAYAGVVFSMPLRRWNRLSAGLSAALLWAIRNDNRHLVVMDEPLDTSYVDRMQRLGTELRWKATTAVSTIARAGIARGTWMDLPSAEPRRPAALTPYWELGASRGGERWSVEVVIALWRNLASSPSNYPLEVSVRRRF